MITNKTKKILLAGSHKDCHSLISKGFGLMFHPKLKNKGLVMYFKNEQKIPIHMWFVFQPLDILYLDKKKIVIELKKNLKPFSYYSPKKNASYVVELPAKSKVNVGDVLSF